MDLLQSVLINLSSNSISAENPLLIPRFDKALREGRGDRVSIEKWVNIQEKVDIVILEGTCLNIYTSTIL